MHKAAVVGYIVDRFCPECKGNGEVPVWRYDSFKNRVVSKLVPCSVCAVYDIEVQAGMKTG